MSNLDNVDRLLAKDAIHGMPDNVCFSSNFIFVVFIEVESGVVFKCHYELSFHEVSNVLVAPAFVASY